MEEMNQKRIEEAKILLPLLRRELGQDATNVSDRNLMKFLLWKPNVQRAASRYRDHIKWRRENSWAFDDPELEISKDTKLESMLKDQIIIAPDSLTSKDGSAVLVGRLRNNNMKDGRQPVDVCRSILYILDRVMEREEAMLNGLIIFHDLNGVSTDNIDIRIPKMLLRGIIGHFPIRIQVCSCKIFPFFN